MQLSRRLSKQKKEILELIPEKEFINLPSICPQYKEHKHILANMISSFPLVTQTMLWEVLDCSQAPVAYHKIWLGVFSDQQIPKL